MATNRLSEAGMAEDLIRSLVQFGCAEIHAKGLYEKATAELDNGLVDVTKEEVLQKQLEKCDAYKADINIYASLRRNVMRKLQEMFPNGSKEMWCQVKHLGIGCMTLFEAYQASDDDVELLTMAYEANKAFTLAISRFLGVTITSCSACFADALKGIERGEEDGGM